nr:putative cuticle collagen 80 isoform X2 [Equus asinus]
METGLCVAEEGPERGSSGPAPDGDGGRGRRGGGEVEKRGGGEEGWRAGAPRPRAPHGHSGSTASLGRFGPVSAQVYPGSERPSAWAPPLERPGPQGGPGLGSPLGTWGGHPALVADSEAEAVGTLPGASFRVCSLLLPLTQSPVIGQGVTVHFLLSPPLMLKNTQPLGHRREDVTH